MPRGKMTEEQLVNQTDISRAQDRSEHPWLKGNSLPIGETRYGSEMPNTDVNSQFSFGTIQDNRNIYEKILGC